MAKNKETLVSILGSSYFQPIADLIDRWFARPRPPANAVQSGYYEHGYAASVILLLVAMFESYVVRVRYLNHKNVPNKFRSALAVLFHLYPRLRHKKALTDIYVLRDAVFITTFGSLIFHGAAHRLWSCMAQQDTLPLVTRSMPLG